jgi:hypothetical protein
MPYEVSQRTVQNLINDANIDIPEHQRPYIWKPKTAEGFIDTIMSGLPTHALIFYQEVSNGKLVKWIEDGQQRFMTVKRFIEGDLPNVKYPLNGVKLSYAELPVAYQTQILNYLFTVTTLENVSREMRISLFQRLQDGIPLTNGQRFNACGGSPLVQLARRLMNDERLESIWGKRSETASFTVLTNAVAIAAGLNLDNDDLITLSYLALAPELGIPISEMTVNERLDKLIDVYERADELHPVGLLAKKKQWNVGYFTGYILYTIRNSRNWEADSQMWVDYIVRCRVRPAYYYIVSHNKPASRNWTRERWETGLQNVRDPENIPETDPSLNSDED